MLQLHGIRQDQVTQVRGFADQRLRHLNDPLDPANRRISLIVQYLEKKPGEQPKPAGEAGEAKPGQAAPKSPEAAKPAEKPAEKK